MEDFVIWIDILVIKKYVLDYNEMVRVNLLILLKN